MHLCTHSRSEASEQERSPGKDRSLDYADQGRQTVGGQKSARCLVTVANQITTSILAGVQQGIGSCMLPGGTVQGQAKSDRIITDPLLVITRTVNNQALQTPYTWRTHINLRQTYNYGEPNSKEQCVIQKLIISGQIPFSFINKAGKFEDQSEGNICPSIPDTTRPRDTLFLKTFCVPTTFKKL